jgi:uncharacterized delta-60 repeat protein
MRGRRRIGAWIAASALLLIVLAAGVAVAAVAAGPGTPDPRFGKGGHVVVPLPDAAVPSRFGPIAAAAGGRFLVAHDLQPDRGGWSATIERRTATGAPDPTFLHSVKVPATIGALAEDPSGGVVYSAGAKVRRLLPSGAPDKSFGNQGAISINQFRIASIAFDTSGRILVGGRFYNSARYFPHEGETAVWRFDPDGQPDPTFGSEGVTYPDGMYEGGSGELGLLSDGSMLVVGRSIEHLSAAGTVLSTPDVHLTDGPHTLVVFPDDSFAVSSSLSGTSGCGVARYGADGSADPTFAEDGVFKEAGLSGCRLLAAPEGGLLVRGTTGTAGPEATPKLLLLTATGTRAADFGTAGSVGVAAPAAAEGVVPWKIWGVAFGPDGRIVVAGGGSAAALVGLTATGSLESAFGNGGVSSEASRQPSWAAPQGIAAEADGELIVTGATDAGSSGHRNFWMRFGPDGRLRPTPSGGRFVSIPMVADQLTPTGPRFVYASVARGGGIAKFERDGRLVASFGKDGVAWMPDGIFASSFLVDPNGGVTVVGSGTEGRVAAYRLTASGHPDPDFSQSGFISVTLPGRPAVGGRSGALLPDGDLVIAGTSSSGLAIAEFGPHGGLRRDFGRGGVLRCRCDGTDGDESATLFHRGYIYVLGSGRTGTKLVKVDPAGRLDRSFAGRGYRSVKIGSALQLLARRGRLLTIGWQGEFDGPAEVRAFRTDGTEDRSYKQRATVVVEGGNAVGELAAALQPGGRLVLAGERRPSQEGVGAQLELLGLR